MYLLHSLLIASLAAASPLLTPRGHGKIAPKVVIVSMFSPEAEVWWGIDEFDLLAQNITVPGLSPLFPEVHCTADDSVCQVVTGESEINAAGTIGALTLSTKFDLTKSYFMIAGIAGVNPEIATLGSVTFAQYAIQVALQYEFDIRDIPSNLTTGYIPFGATSPREYPQNIYGTEVFEVNAKLRDMALSFASTASLNDTSEAASYRARYAPASAYAAATSPPSIVACDVATSDVYYSGTLLSEAFSNTTSLFTNGSGTYCTTAQEDNASLSAILRADLANLTDYSRAIVMRTASDFDRPPPGVSDLQNLLYIDQGGFPPAIQNIYLAGIKVVMGILENWDGMFEAGVKAENYIGDIFDSLGGTPDFGLPSEFLSKRGEKREEGVKGNMRMKRSWEGMKRAVERLEG